MTDLDVRLHSVIYELFDEVKDSMAGMLSPEVKEAVRGIAEIRQTFSVGKGGKVAGCMVTQGSVMPKFKVRVRRGEEVLFEGNIQSLKHFQDSVRAHAVVVGVVAHIIVATYANAVSHHVVGTACLHLL